VDENPLTAQDILHYDNTMRASVDRFVPFANVCFYVRFYRISYICIPYFISVTDRREIVGDDDLSSASDSDSVLEMFSIPPLGRPSQQQCQERSSFLYPTAPAEHACHPLKASPLLPAEDLLMALLSSLAMAEQAFDLPTMPLV
jgi:hypothetical protein